MADVKYLPTIRVGKDLVVFPWRELMGDTHEQALENLNPFGWEGEKKRLWTWLLELDMSPTGETVKLGGGHEIKYYSYKIGEYGAWLIGGEVFDKLEKKNANEGTGVQASD